MGVADGNALQMGPAAEALVEVVVDGRNQIRCANVSKGLWY
jgi:hypothetical protein